MTRKVFVVGVGVTNFVKPNTGKDYPEMGKEAVEDALADARIPYDVAQQAVPSRKSPYNITWVWEEYTTPNIVDAIERNEDIHSKL